MAWCSPAPALSPSKGYERKIRSEGVHRTRLQREQVKPRACPELVEGLRADKMVEQEERT